MSGVRRALLYTATERFIVLSVNFGSLAVVARLLSPEEIGYSVVGAATLAMAESLRDFGASGFIVQQVRLDHEDARTAATIMLILSLAISFGLWTGAGAIASFFHKDHFQSYIHLTALTFLAGPFSGPLMALLRRDMRFGALAVINILSSTGTALTTLLLAALGMSFMSFAWGSAVGASTAAVFAILLCRQHWILRPCLRGWRETLSFGLYTSGASLAERALDSLPSLILGRAMTLNDVAFYNRAAMVCTLPNKCVLSGLLPVVFPAMAARVRDGRSLEPAFLRGLSLITVFQWPAFLLLALLAEPAVRIILGEQWTSIVPLVRIMAVASVAGSPNVLFYPTIVAIGAYRKALWSGLIILPIGAATTLAASRFGIVAVAYGFAVIVMAQSLISIAFLQTRLALGWRVLGDALGKSALVTVCSVAVPILDVALAGQRGSISVPGAAIIATETGIGWAVGLLVTRHPLVREIRHMLEALELRWGHAGTLPWLSRLRRLSASRG